MTEGRESVVRSPTPAPRPEADGGRARFDITPDQVWQSGRPAPPPSPEQDSRAFFAPLARVAVISAALIYGAIGAGVALWLWLR